MNCVLEDLYFGEIQPNVSDCGKNPHLKKCAQVVDENEQMLINLLEGKEHQLFLELLDAQGEIDGIGACENFINGFKLGAKIMVESIIEPLQ